MPVLWITSNSKHLPIWLKLCLTWGACEKLRVLVECSSQKANRDVISPERQPWDLPYQSSSLRFFLLFEHKSKVTVHCIAISPLSIPPLNLSWNGNKNKDDLGTEGHFSILVQRYVNTSSQHKAENVYAFLPSLRELPCWNCYYVENNPKGLAPWNKRSNMINSSDKQQDPRASNLLTRHFPIPLF